MESLRCLNDPELNRWGFTDMCSQVDSQSLREKIQGVNLKSLQYIRHNWIDK